MILQISCRFRTLSALVLFLAGAAASAPVIALGQAQTAVESLVRQTIDEASLVTLPGNTHRLAQSRYDRGAVPATQSASRMMLLLKRSPQQESSLQSYLQTVQIASSPLYRKFLTPEEFGKKFGISDADLDTVQTWLQNEGFTVNKVNKGRTAIEFSGTIGQIQQAFHTTIHRYVLSGIEHWANSSDPMIPAALSPVIAGVANLNDFKPHTQVIKGPAGRWSPEKHRFTPDLTVTNGGSRYLFVTPGDAATIYNAPNSLNTHLASNQAKYDGTGITIGVVGDTWLDFSDNLNYQSLFGLDAYGGYLTIVYDGNELNYDQTADQTEALLDTEVSGGLAPGAHIIYYTAGDTELQSGVFLAIYRAIDDNKVNILSLSYGECEASLGAAGNEEILNAWEQAAAQGITVVVSSGDSGSAGCDDMNTESVATQGLAVNGLASTPYNIAVGGTDFDVLANSFSTYVNSTNSLNYTSALSYIPENPWNNSTATNELLSANSVYSNSSAETNIVAGGGGASSLGNEGQSAYSKPAWQQGFSPSNTDTVRDIPDVSLLAANGQYGALWAVCAENDCPGSNGTVSGVGGTSASAPAFAGILALVNQKIGASTRMGQADWVLYQLAQASPSAFHQIVSGNNSVYCVAQSLNCGTNGFLTGYNAGSGYNLATGLGSVDIANLVNNWSDNSLISTSTSLSLDKTNFTHGASVNISVGVNPSAATGNVAIENNYAAQAKATTSVAPTLLTLNGGAASASYSQFPGGTYNVYANYGGDGTSYAGSVSSPVAVTVTPEDSTLQLSVNSINSSSQPVNAAGTTVPLGTVLLLNAQPIGASQVGRSNPITNATGTVTFFDLLEPAPGSVPLDASGNAVIYDSFAVAGTHSITASYGGDLSYNSSNSSAVSFTVSPAATTISVTSSTNSIDSGSLNIYAQIAASIPINSIQPTGTVTFTDSTNNTVLGTSPPTGIPCAGTKTFCHSIGLQVGVTQLAMGVNSIVASYTGDSNFVGSGPSAATTVTCTAGCSNGTGQTVQLSFGQQSSGIISPGGTITAVVSVGPGGGFTGAVNITCSVTGKNSSDQHVPTCSINPAQVNVTSNQAVSTTLTINTTASSGASLHRSVSSPWRLPEGAALALLMLLNIRGRRYRQRYLLGVFTLCLMVGWATGCGGGSAGSNNGAGSGSGGSGTPGTTADVYTVTFRAADAASGTVTAVDYFNFTVN